MRLIVAVWNAVVMVLAGLVAMSAESLAERAAEAYEAGDPIWKVYDEGARHDGAWADRLMRLAGKPAAAAEGSDRGGAVSLDGGVQ